MMNFKSRLDDSRKAGVPPNSGLQIDAPRAFRFAYEFSGLFSALRASQLQQESHREPQNLP
jgi:hypothetical protein